MKPISSNKLVILCIVLQFGNGSDIYKCQKVKLCLTYYMGTQRYLSNEYQHDSVSPTI